MTFQEGPGAEEAGAGTVTREPKAQDTTVALGDLQLREIVTKIGDPDTHVLDAKLAAGLVAGEKVHPVKGTEHFSPIMDFSLHRVGGTAKNNARRCFGLFAPGSDTPSATVYVYLQNLPTNAQGNVESRDLPGDISTILAGTPQKVSDANTAIFYTISNLGGPTILRSKGDPSPAELLIQKVAEKLGKEGITNFTTLSPLRSGMDENAKGFAQWLQGLSNSNYPLLTANETTELQSCVDAHGGKEFFNASKTPAKAVEFVRRRYTELSQEQRAFFAKLMTSLGLHYLANLKAPGKDGTNRAVYDPVDSFHLGNGAEIAKIHWQPPELTTASETLGGGGLMVNYRYDLNQLSARKEAYKERGTIAMDPELRKEYEARFKELKIPACTVSGTARTGVLTRSAEALSLG